MINKHYNMFTSANTTSQSEIALDAEGLSETGAL